MDYNPFSRISNSKFSWTEDWTRTLGDIHWLFRNVAQVGRITDGLENLFDAKLTPGEKVVMDLGISASLALKGLAAYSSVKGQPGGLHLVGMSECADGIMLCHYYWSRLRNHDYTENNPKYDPGLV
tara:strand:- start:7749 stop:8126 length:378 start_codon:yes stop_codon:yes gene_type:complete